MPGPSNAKTAVQLPMVARTMDAGSELAEHAAQLDNLLVQVGQQPYRGGQGAVGVTVTPPPQAALSVAAASGIASVGVANAASLPPGAAPLHEVVSSLNTSFDANGDTITYGPSSQLSITENKPGQRRYYRVRSKYPNSGFNQPVVYGPFYTGAT